MVRDQFADAPTETKRLRSAIAELSTDRLRFDPRCLFRQGGFINVWAPTHKAVPFRTDLLRRDFTFHLTAKSLKSVFTAQATVARSLLRPENGCRFGLRLVDRRTQ